MNICPKTFCYFASVLIKIFFDMGKEMVLIEVSELDKIVRSAVRDEMSRTTDNCQSETCDNGYYNTNELAELLSIDRTTIWTWEKKGLLKCKRVGRRKLYSKREINDLINSGKLSRYCRE